MIAEFYEVGPDIG